MRDIPNAPTRTTMSCETCNTLAQPAIGRRRASPESDGEAGRTRPAPRTRAMGPGAHRRPHGASHQCPRDTSIQRCPSALARRLSRRSACVAGDTCARVSTSAARVLSLSACFRRAPSAPLPRPPLPRTSLPLLMTRSQHRPLISTPLRCTATFLSSDIHLLRRFRSLPLAPPLCCPSHPAGSGPPHSLLVMSYWVSPQAVG